MTENSSKKHRIVVKLKCTSTFAGELRSALTKEFDADICFLKQPRIQEALPEPVQEAAAIITLLGGVTMVYQAIKYIVLYIRGARRESHSRLDEEPVCIGASEDGPFLDVENSTSEDIDEFVERLLESEK